MTAPQPATPGSDGEVCACGHFWKLHDAATEECFVWVQTEQGRAYCVCPSFRPAAPSEPPAADSPTPGTCGEWVVTRRCARPVGHEGWHRNGDQASGVASYVAPSPVDATEPPADTQQDDERVARRFLARHYWVMASAVNVGDWQAYIRTCARAQEDGSAWLDNAALDELRAALAARPSADTETLRRVREVRNRLSQLAIDFDGTVLRGSNAYRHAASLLAEALGPR